MAGTLYNKKTQNVHYQNAQNCQIVRNGVSVPKRFTYVRICFNTTQDLELVKSHLLPTMQEETYTQS